MAKRPAVRDRSTDFLTAEFPDADERALLLGIAKAPTDNTAKLVYADWLDERSDPRGEYVRAIVQRGGKKPLARVRKWREACSGPWLSLMGELQSEFDALARSVASRPDVARGWHSELTTKCADGLWEFDYTGNLWLEPDGLEPVLEFLCAPKIARVLRVISLSAHEDHPNVNGTLHLSLSPMTRGGASFPYLEELWLDQSDGTILCGGQGEYAENGETARLIAACPNLLTLGVPSAPNTDFFSGPAHPLELLSVHAGYDTQGFIPNLTRSERFPKLRRLEYKDFCCEYMTPAPPMFTPFGEWEAFFRSPTCAAIEEIKLEGVVLTKAEIRALHAIRPDVGITQSSVVRN